MRRRRFLHAVTAVIAASLTLTPSLASVATVPAASSSSMNPTAATEAAAKTQSERPAVLGETTISQGLAVSIDSLQPAVITTQTEVTLSGTVKNTTEQTVSAPLLSVAVDWQTPISVQELTQTLTSGIPFAAPVLQSQLGSDIAPGASVPFSLTIPTSTLPFGDASEWGPRVVAVTARSGNDQGEDRTILLWDSGVEVQPTRVTVVTPWTVDNAVASSSSSTQFVTPESEREREALLHLGGLTGSTLAIDPTVVPKGPSAPTDSVPTSPKPSSSESSSGRTADTSSMSGSAHTPPRPADSSQTPKGDEDEAANAAALRDWNFIIGLYSTMKEVVALPAGDPDVGALALADQSALISQAKASVEAFPLTPAAAGWIAHPQDNAGESQQSDGSDPVVDPQTTVGPTVLDDVVWPASSSFSQRHISTFSTAVTLAPPGALTPADYTVSYTPTSRVEVSTSDGSTSPTGETEQTATVLASNKALSDILGWQSSQAGDQLDASQAVQAISAIITRELPNYSRAVLALTPRGTPLTENLTDRVSTLLGSRWVSGMTLGDLAQSEATDIERDRVPTPDLPQDTHKALKTVDLALTSIQPFAAATNDPTSVLAEVSTRALGAIGAGIPPKTQVSRASALSRHVAGLRSTISVQPSSSINLINKSADFPVRVSNASAWDVTVAVTLDPADPRMRVPRATQKTIPAGSVTTVDVPVEAIGSGDLEVTYVISTPDGSVIERSQSVLVRLHAGWEDAFTITMAALLGVLFLFGLVRTVRQRRHRVAAHHALEAVRPSLSAPPKESE
ncbi:DUF6049 family protein [Schaalia sp. ZJ1691]|uniref:DUF6049 family protein n=1 Tax=Schaalia sp. ZJ1691 TaxID=2709404 RepID=UPI0013EE3AB0|nr:DUF6049 family protein [Schaalia sp. ZJ1691]